MNGAILKGEAASGVFAAAEPAVVNAETAKAGDITWMPGWQIRDLIAEREVSPVEVVKHFLARIEKLDPILHAFSFVDSQGALAQAKQAEKAVLRGERLGPLHGIPIALKSHILVKGYDMQEIWEPERHPGMHDDIGTERLRKAGAIILGHTIYPAMGTGGVPQGGDPIKNLENHPRNPWNPQRVPGSSSAGSAAATASAMLPFTIGSDGGGSTRLPAALSGVIGVHPSRGRIPFVQKSENQRNIHIYHYRSYDPERP
jgi:Asp-tRNA(Asn)/Glu-tRNA(Gln) amidotransferase A subunit family amidase